MPLYDYRCSSCQTEFELRLPLEEYKNPTKTPCPYCSNLTIEQFLPLAPGLVDAMRIGVKKPPSDFSKYVLGKIKAANPGSTIGTRHFDIPKEI